jgi:signal peptidase I
VQAPRKAGTPFGSLLRQLLQVLVVAGLAFGSYFIVSHFFVQSVTVVGVSMAPTLADSQRYLLNRWVFHVRSPHSSDVVVIRDPMDNGYSVKRIVAVAGDSVWLREGNVYINGTRLAEPYLSPGTPTYASALSSDQVFQCAKNEFFVLGDNRNNSVDSRAYGPIPKQNILGLIIR